MSSVLPSTSPDAFLGSSFSCAGRAALITGASSGIGAHFARVLAAAGCRKIALLARRVDKLEALATELSAQYPGLVCATVQCDVAVEEDVIAAFDQAEKIVNGTFDVVINNAGVGTYFCPIC
jgi:short-subunit dehydrogenase